MKLEYRKDSFVDENDFKKYATSISNYKKEDLYIEMQKFYNPTRESMDKLGPGSKEHVEVFYKICEKMGIKTGEGENYYNKPKLVKSIIDFADKYNKDLDFYLECVSTGDTITAHAYKLVCYSIWFFKNTIESNFNKEFKYVSNPSTLLNQYKNDALEYYEVLSEFIDNSIASYENDILSETEIEKLKAEIDPLTIHIIFKQDSIMHGDEKQSIYIIDDGGGLNQNYIESAFTIGNKKEFGGLNVFGVGMKRAAYWWTDKFYFTSYIGGATKPYKVTNKITNPGPVIEPLELGKFAIERNRLSDKFTGRESGTILQLVSEKNFKDNNPGYIYREVKQTDFNKIYGALSTKYSSYIGKEGYLSPEGKLIKVNIHLTFEKNGREIEKQLLSDDEIGFYLEPLKMPYWEEMDTLPNETEKEVSWSDNFEIKYKNACIKMNVYIQAEGRRETATICHVFRGKKLQYYVFGYPSENTQYKTNKGIKYTYEGISEKPRVILGQTGQRVANSVRGEIDFTDIGKSEKGTSINIKKEDLDEIYRRFGEEFKKSRIGKMAKNFSRKVYEGKIKNINNPIKPSTKKEPERSPIPSEEKIEKVEIINLHDKILTKNEVYIETINKRKIYIKIQDEFEFDINLEDDNKLILEFGKEMINSINQKNFIKFINIIIVYMTDCQKPNITSINTIFEQFKDK